MPRRPRLELQGRERVPQEVRGDAPPPVQRGTVRLHVPSHQGRQDPQDRGGPAVMAGGCHKDPSPATAPVVSQISCCEASSPTPLRVGLVFVLHFLVDRVGTYRNKQIGIILHRANDNAIFPIEGDAPQSPKFSG